MGSIPCLSSVSDISQFSIQQSLIVGILSKPDQIAIPPKVEVDERRYEYQPCPLLDEAPMPFNVFLHYLTSDSPAAHLHSMWTSRLPKKIDDSIFSSKQPMALGWGVHIVEGVDHIKVIWITICGILASCTATGLWWGLEKDISGETELGSLMLTILGLMIAYSIVTKRYGWAEQLSQGVNREILVQLGCWRGNSLKQ